MRLVLESQLVDFIRSSIRSVWTLELLVLLRRCSPATMTLEQAARELRGTETLVAKCVPQLEAAGLIVHEGKAVKFAPASPALQELSALLEMEYRERPVAVVDAIVSGQSDRLRALSDAFRFKENDE